MFLLNGNPLQLDTPFTVNGTSYPANWLRFTSIGEKNAIGITEVPDPQPVIYDDRFYWGINNPKNLDDLKKQWTKQIKEIAHSLLSKTDWAVIRKIERNVDIPVDMVAYRTNVIAECTRLVTNITGCTDVPSLRTIVITQNWPQET